MMREDTLSSLDWMESSTYRRVANKHPESIEPRWRNNAGVIAVLKIINAGFQKNTGFSQEQRDRIQDPKSGLSDHWSAMLGWAKRHFGNFFQQKRADIWPKFWLELTYGFLFTVESRYNVQNTLNIRHGVIFIRYNNNYSVTGTPYATTGRGKIYLDMLNVDLFN